MLDDPSYQGERPAVRDLAERVQSLTTAGDYKQFQLDLMRKVRLMQDGGDELRRRQEALQGAIREAAGQDPKPVEVLKDKSQQLEWLKHKHRVVSAMRWIYLGLGDAMAWRLLRYERGALAVLSQGDRVARFAADEGFQPELEELDERWARGFIAIHNDLTTCLRHGDITAFDPDSRTVHLYEVKRGSETRPDSAQMKRIEQAVGVLMAGRVERDDDMPLNANRLDIPYTTHLAELKPLMKRARADGYAAGKAGDCFYLQVRRFDSGLTPQELADRQAGTEQAQWWVSDDVQRVQWGSTLRRLRERQFSIGGLAPLALFPMEFEDLTDLLMGFADVAVVLDIDCVKDSFRAQGLRVATAPNAKWDSEFLHVTRRVEDRLLTTVVGAALREQMLNELMTPECVVATAGALLDLRETPDSDGSIEAHAVTLGGEAQVWQARTS